MSNEKLIIENFTHMSGTNCQLSSLRKVLAFQGFNITEPMLMGIGAGLGFIYWDMKLMPTPFVGGLNGKGINLFETPLRNLGGKAELMKKTTSRKVSYEQTKEVLRSGEPIIPFVDIAYLPYFYRDDATYPNEAAGHFGGHTFVVYGLDEQEDSIYISDRFCKTNSLTIDQFMDAHSSQYAPFAAKNIKLSIIAPEKEINWEKVIRNAIRENRESMLNPPITNLGLKGILKFEKMVGSTWMKFPPDKLLYTLFSTYLFNASGGSGGALCRNLYVEFLEEAQGYIEDENLVKATEIYREAAKEWDSVALCLLPDELPALKVVRSTIVESNIVQEQAEKDYQKQLRNIDNQWLEIKEEAIKEISSFEIFIPKLQRAIRNAHEIETKAWNLLELI